MPTLNLTAYPVLQMQALNEGQQHGATQFLAVGSALYYVIRDQVGVAPTNDLLVYKSLDKTTWSLVATLTPTGAPIANNESHDVPVVLVGAVIYCLGAIVDSTVNPSLANLVFHRFDTSTDSFLADGALGPNQAASNNSGATDQTYTCCTFNDGTILVPSGVTVSAPALGDFGFQVYDPAGNSWSATTPVTTNDGSRPVQITHDSVTDLAFVFYAAGGTTDLRCVTVPAGAGSFTDVLVDSFPTGPFPNTSIGLPIVTSAGDVVVPYRWFPLVGPPFMKAARATAAATPTFTVETVDDGTTLPAGYFPQGWDQIAGPGWMAREIGGVLFVLYAVDNGDLDSGASQTFLYYSFSTAPGVWAPNQIAYSSVVPGEMLIPYGSLLPGFDPVLLLGIIDPTLWPDVSSLTTFILFGGAAPVPDLVTVILHGYKLVPDPQCGDAPLVGLPYVRPARRVR